MYIVQKQPCRCVRNTRDTKTIPRVSVSLGLQITLSENGKVVT